MHQSPMLSRANADCCPSLSQLLPGWLGVPLLEAPHRLHDFSTEPALIALFTSVVQLAAGHNQLVYFGAEAGADQSAGSQPKHSVQPDGASRVQQDS